MTKESFGFGENVCWRSITKLPETSVRSEQSRPCWYSSRWITRIDAEVDRVACPWLIRRFIDPRAEFFFVPEDRLLESAHKLGAIPFDANRFPEIKLNHRGERCTFEAILEDYALQGPTLERLALVVRGRTSKDRNKLHQRIPVCAQSHTAWRGPV